MTWFVLRARWGYEASLAKIVNGWGTPFRALCPVNETRWFSRGVAHERLVPLFATYVFVDWEPKDSGEAWHRVVDIDGASGFIGGEFPVAVRESDLQEWIDNVDSNGVVRGLEELLRKLKRGFDRGDRVRIEGGTFGDRIGTCNWTDDRGVNLELIVFGREVSVYVADVDARFRLEEKAEKPQKVKKNRDYLTNAVRATNFG